MKEQTINTAHLSDLIARLRRLFDKYGDLPIYSLEAFGHAYGPVHIKDLDLIKVLEESDDYSQDDLDAVHPERLDINLNRDFSKDTLERIRI